MGPAKRRASFQSVNGEPGGSSVGSSSAAVGGRVSTATRKSPDRTRRWGPSRSTVMGRYT